MAVVLAIFMLVFEEVEMRRGETKLLDTVFSLEYICVFPRLWVPSGAGELDKVDVCIDRYSVEGGSDMLIDRPVAVIRPSCLAVTATPAVTTQTYQEYPPNPYTSSTLSRLALNPSLPLFAALFFL
jgi:hypothetical protein